MSDIGSWGEANDSYVKPPLGLCAGHVIKQTMCLSFTLIFLRYKEVFWTATSFPCSVLLFLHLVNFPRVFLARTFAGAKLSSAINASMTDLLPTVRGAIILGTGREGIKPDYE